MCTQFTHSCYYCNCSYDCNEPDWVCPTLNNDTNAHMCDSCHDRLEEALEDWKGKQVDFPLNNLKEDE